MSKKLAIQGHPTRGKEVIKLLEMMGGTNPFSDGMVIGNKVTNCYYISEDTTTKYISWDYISPDEINEYEILTLEEFFKKYPFKVGDRVLIPEYESEVRICEMQWDGFEIQYKVYRNDEVEWYTTEELLNYNDDFLEDNHCNENQINGMKNVLAELYEHIKTTPKEELEREFDEIKEWLNVGPTVEEFMAFCKYKSIGQGTYAIKIADGYKFDRIDENDNIIVKPIKPKYPTTYDDCCNMLNADEFVEYELMTNFPKLINARNAYWKIAGEQMGLGKPWEPDWNDSKPKYTIIVIENKLVLHHALSQNHILAFPTEEIRDAFYENFKDLIERCKELL